MCLVMVLVTEQGVQNGDSFSFHVLSGFPKKLLKWILSKDARFYTVRFAKLSCSHRWRNRGAHGPRPPTFIFGGPGPSTF